MTDECRDPGGAQDVLEPQYALLWRGGEGQLGSRIVRDQIHLRANPAEPANEPPGILLTIVDVVEHHVFEGDPFVPSERILATCGLELFERPSPIDRHEPIAQRVRRRRERDGQFRADGFVREAPNPRDDARRREGDPPLGDVQPSRFAEESDRFQNVLVIQERERAVRHEPDAPGEPPTHRIRIAAGTLLAHLAGGTTADVNSFHHQAVRDVGRDLKPIAWSEDGIIEAVLDVRPDVFILGVQWHPELTFASDAFSRAIFAHFLHEAARRAS